MKPFVKRHKNDAVDAEAICEAAQRPSMRFVAVKSEEQQAAGLVFRTRDLVTASDYVQTCPGLSVASKGASADANQSAHGLKTIAPAKKAKPRPTAPSGLRSWSP